MSILKAFDCQLLLESLTLFEHNPMGFVGHRTATNFPDDVGSTPEASPKCLASSVFGSFLLDIDGKHGQKYEKVLRCLRKKRKRAESDRPEPVETRDCVQCIMIIINNGIMVMFRSCMRESECI